MKNNIFKRFGSSSVFALIFCLVWQTPVSAQQGCDLTFSPYPAPLSSYITAYPYAIESKGAQQQLVSWFAVDVTNIVNHTNYPSPPIPYGVYPAWCVDATTSIDPAFATVPGTLYSGHLYSTCDSNLNSELPPGHTNTLVSAGIWQMVNYILNYHLNNGTNAFYYDVQAAINTLVGSAVGSTNPCGGLYTTPTPDGGCGNYPVYDPVVVSNILAAATNNAPGWVPQCGQVLGAIYVTATTNQFLLIEVPVPCTPCISVTKTVACLGLSNSCGAFGSVARGYAGVGCSSVNEPAFCYQIVITNCGTIPLTNVVVSDNLLGDLSTNFLTNKTEVFEPGASITNYFSMSFAANATNTVTVTGAAALAQTVTNGTEVYTNGTPVTANDSAVALVDTASVTCALNLYSPLNLNTNVGDNNVILPAANYYSTSNTVTLSIGVTNTGLSDLSDVTITLPALTNFNCSAPGPFNLAAGASTNIQLCLGLVTCPASMTLDVTVTGEVMSDTNHCAIYTSGDANISVCSSCMGSISCSPSPGCTGGIADLSGTILLNCIAGNTDFSGDSGLPGVAVILFGAGNTPLGTNTTDLNGNYTFTNLAAGLYYVEAVAPTNYIQTYPAGNFTEITVTNVPCSPSTNVDFAFADTTPPIISVPPGGYLGCNPTNLPTDASLASNVTAAVSCGAAITNITYIDSNTNCSYTRTFTIVVSDTYGNSATNYVTDTWTEATLVLTNIPAGGPLGCNPGTASFLTDASVSNAVSFVDSCSAITDSVTHQDTNSGCNWTRVFTVSASDACGDSAVAYVTNTWTEATLVLTNIPAGGPLGCNPGTASFLTDASVSNAVSFVDSCSAITDSVTHQDTNSGCNWTRVFTISASDACGDSAVAYVTNTWTEATLAFSNIPIGGPLGCNPTNVPSNADISNLVSLVDSCSSTMINVTNSTLTNQCAVTQIFTILATDLCGDSATAYVTNTWTANTIAPILCGVPAGKNLGCNPTNVPTLASVQNAVTSTNDTCSPATIIVSGGVPKTNACQVTQIFNIVATNACGNTVTACVTNTWTANTTAPILCGVPVGKNLGCNPTSVPTLASVQAAVFSTNDTCSPATVMVSGGVPSTNGCSVTQVFAILATNACGNIAMAYVTNNWTALPTILVTNFSYMTNTVIVTNVSFATNITFATNTTTVTNITITTNCCTNAICGTFNSLNPGSGWLWLNAHISGNPGSNCTVTCQNASVTLACTDGKTYTFPVPNGTVNFSSTCTVATNWFDGTNWHTTLPCIGDNGIFAQGCAIPWQSDFANCKSVCWTAVFSCSTPGFNCNWQWGAACYSDTQPACGSIAPKACLQTSCPGGQYYSSSDQCGTPENHKPYCIGGGTGSGGNNCTGSWAGTSTTCVFGITTNKTTTPVTTITTNTAITTNITTTPVTTVTTNTTVTTATAGPVLSGVPAGTNFGCNPTSVSTVASVQAEVTASVTCSTAPVQVTQVTTTNGCAVTQVFTITAVNACGNSATAYVTNTWTADTIPPVITGVPANSFLGCGVTNLPGDSNVLSEVKATDLCGTASVTVSHVDTTNGCVGTRTFTITATDACGNIATTNLIYTWTGKTPETCTNSICAGFNSKNPGSGWLWLNAHISGNPGQNATLYCQNASVTLSCTDGKSYTFPVPNGIVNFSSTCTVATNWYDGSNWNTTLPCAGDSQIFLHGCAIPWQSDFANCQVCWTGVFSCTTPGLSFNWQWGAACYANTLPAYANICPKACYQTACQNGQYYNANDNAGCPENHKPYCVGGGTGLGGANCTGSWSGTDTTCTFTSGTSTPPVLNGIPANDNLGINPTNIPTVASVLAEVTASDTCSPAPVNVTMKLTTNSCIVTQIFTISATNDCAAYAIAYVTNTWTTLPLTNHCTNTICSSFNSQNPGSGWLWLNCQLTGKPGSQEVLVTCSNATVTLSCTDGKTYTFPVPNGQILFSPNCTTGTNWFDGTNWNTTLPCGGDDQIFVSGCAIPWQSDFANCKSVCWNGVFSCNVPGLSFNWQFGAACYSDSQPGDYNSICPKACHQTPCQNGQYYNSSHNAGTPENHNPYCVGGGTGFGGSNCTGNFSNPGTCNF
jgi:hypothetical protein